MATLSDNKFRVLLNPLLHGLRGRCTTRFPPSGAIILTTLLCAQRLVSRRARCAFTQFDCVCATIPRLRAASC